MENLNGKIVTVFGGTGFLGNYIISKLASAGYTIKVVGRRAESAKDVKTQGYVGQIVPVSCDVTKPADLEAIIKGSFAVVNAIGILYEHGKQKFDLLHAQIPEKIAQAAKKQGVERLVHISAIVEEETNSKYARSKINGEKAVISAFTGATILKPSVVFGTEDNFFNLFAKMSNISPALPLIGGGKNKFQPVYVGDVAEAVLRCVEVKKPGRYELGGPEQFSFKQVMQLVLKHTGRKRLLLNQPRPIAKLTAILTPSSVLTLDQVELIKHDNIVNEKALNLETLGIDATDVDTVLPTYLGRFKAAA